MSGLCESDSPQFLHLFLSLKLQEIRDVADRGQYQTLPAKLHLLAVHLQLLQLWVFAGIFLVTLVYEIFLISCLTLLVALIIALEPSNVVPHARSRARWVFLVDDLV